MLFLPRTDLPVDEAVVSSGLVARMSRPPPAPIFPNHRRATFHVLAAGAFTNRCAGALHGDATWLQMFDRLVFPDKIQT